MPCDANDKLEWKVEVLKAMGHPIRLSVVELLEKSELSVREIEAHLDIEASTISKHLAVLKRVGIVECSREGPRWVCRVCLTGALDIARLLEGAAYEHLKKQLPTMVV